MSDIDIQTVERLTQLAQIDLPEHKAQALSHDLGSIFDFIALLSEANTDNVAPLLSTLELTQTPAQQREDIVSEPNQRDALQAIAPEVADGLYLVPEVIE
jgi:aspartyl-tRNA(Asn)/glutamyl-tRNA(Gln) amidotransferase subunit C